MSYSNTFGNGKNKERMYDRNVSDCYAEIDAYIC